jgi:membrane fusion protein, multidrug efflux system
MRFGKFLALLIVGGAIAGGTYYVYTAKAPEGQAKERPGARFRNMQANRAVPVLVAPARIADVPIYLDGVGTARALNTVTVRAQVDGQLMKLTFREGQDVKRGQVLAEIDPRTYQAQLDQAVAKKAQDEAQLANAKLDLERYERLALSNAATKQQADAARASVAQLTALVKADQAAIDNTRIILDYTKVIAPIDGRTGIRMVDEGNLVRGSDTTGIVSITQVKPINVLFNLPQQQLADVNKAFAKGALVVEALGPDGRKVIDAGKLDVVDNQVDSTTGTVRLKSEFPNADLQLWPGQFVNVRLLLETLKQVVVVPTAAVQRGPTGTFVFVAQADETVAVRDVTVGQQDDTQAVITAGVQAGERVVTTGFSQLAAGTRITVSTDAPGVTPAERPRRRDGSETPQSGVRPGDGTPRPEGERKRRRETTGASQ